MDRKLGQISGKRFSPVFRCMQENDPYRTGPRTMVSCRRKGLGPHRFRVTNGLMRRQPYKEWATAAPTASSSFMLHTAAQAPIRQGMTHCAE